MNHRVCCWNEAVAKQKGAVAGVGRGSMGRWVPSQHICHSARPEMIRAGYFLVQYASISVAPGAVRFLAEALHLGKITA